MSADRSAIEVVKAGFPELQRPGERRAYIAIRNNGADTRHLKLKGTVNKSIVVNSQRTTSFYHNYVLRDKPYSVNVDIVDEDSGDIVSNIDTTVTPHKYVSIDTDSGKIRFAGGFGNPVDYEVKLIGNGVYENPNLTSASKVLGNMDDALFQGKAPSTYKSSTPIEFNKAEVIDAEATEKVEWVVDGEPRGASTTFRYATIAGEAIFDSPKDIRNKDRIMLNRRPRIHINAGPSDRVGTLRKRSGMASNLLNRTSIVEKITSRFK